MSWVLFTCLLSCFAFEIISHGLVWPHRVVEDDFEFQFPPLPAFKCWAHVCMLPHRTDEARHGTNSGLPACAGRTLSTEPYSSLKLKLLKEKKNIVHGLSRIVCKEMNDLR